MYNKVNDWWGQLFVFLTNVLLLWNQLLWNQLYKKISLFKGNMNFMLNTSEFVELIEVLCTCYFVPIKVPICKMWILPLKQMEAF